MISGLVLAAGRSTRLGAPKQLLELAGKPLLQHVIDACAASPLDEVVVVLGHAASEIAGALELPARARIVVNHDHPRGQASSLRVGLATAHPASEAVVILLGDQPGVTPELIGRALEAWRRSDAPILRSYFGDVPGHPVVAARSAWPLLAEAAGDEGARGVFARGSVDVAELRLDAPPPVDVDTWADFERLTWGVRPAEPPGAPPERS